MRDYYEDQTRCPQIGYEQSLLEKWPNLPKIVAGIKFALAKNEGWENDPNTTATRKKLLAVLEDSNFTIKYSDSPRGKATKASIKELLERTARNEEFASGQPLDGNTLQLGPTSDFNRYKDIPDPNDPSKFLVKQEDTGLAVSIIHELVHITQLREDPTLTNIHAGGDPAYDFSVLAPPLSLVKAGDDFLDAASDCEKKDTGPVGQLGLFGATTVDVESCSQGPDQDFICFYTISVTVEYTVNIVPVQVDCFLTNQVPVLNPIEPDSQEVSESSGVITLKPRTAGLFDPATNPKFDNPGGVNCTLGFPLSDGSQRRLDKIDIDGVLFPGVSGPPT